VTNKDGVFISHFGDEGAAAHKLKSLLRQVFGRDLKVYISSDYECITGGKNWFQSVVDNMKAVQIVLVLVSQQSVGRKWIRGGNWYRRRGKGYTCGISRFCQSRQWQSAGLISGS
jgi:hypothetical protein